MRRADLSFYIYFNKKINTMDIQIDKQIFTPQDNMKIVDACWPNLSSTF
ncbi:MAG: hypothetical protein REV35_00595 [Burkholderia sp.]|nr:hypothetical protein [Burkholderia sp.]